MGPVSVKMFDGRNISEHGVTRILFIRNKNRTRMMTETCLSLTEIPTQLDSQ